MDLIALQYTDNGDKPLEDIVIESITIDLNGYVPGTPVCAD